MSARSNSSETEREKDGGRQRALSKIACQVRSQVQMEITLNVKKISHAMVQLRLHRRVTKRAPFRLNDWSVEAFWRGV
jgi:hypothetical protein